MTKRRVWLRYFLGEVTVFGAVHSLLSVCLAVWTETAWLILPALLLFLPWLLMGLLRARVNNVALVLLGHVALAALPVLLPLAFAPKALLTAGTVLLALLSLGKRLAAERTERERRSTYGRGTQEEYERIRGDGAVWRLSTGVLIFLLALNVVLIFCSGVFGSQGANSVLAAWAPVYLVCGLITRQTAGVDQALSHLRSGARQPVQAVLRMQNTVLILLLVLVLLLILPASVLPLGAVLYALGDWIMLGIRALIRWLFAGGDGAEEPPPTEQQAPPPQGENILEQLPQGEAGIVWVILGYVLAVVVLAALVLLVIWAVIHLLRRFSGARGVGDGDQREFLKPSMEKQAAKRQPLWRPRFGSGPQARVRRAYYRAVRRQIRRGARVTQAQTTGEIQQALAGTEGLPELTQLYNEARYGKSPL